MKSNFHPILMIRLVPQDHVTGVGDMFCNGDFQTFKATMDRLLDKNIDYAPTETPHTLLMVLFQL